MTTTNVAVTFHPWCDAPVPAPKGQVLAAIGDVHGMSGQFRALLEAIAAEREELQLPGQLFLLGDLVDRGPDPIGALRMAANAGDITGLTLKGCMGNHDDWLVRWLDGSLGSEIEDWMWNGGRDTLDGFGLNRGQGAAGAELLGAKVVDFLDSLRPFHIVGRWAFVHAGFDPSAPIEQQNPWTNSWIRGPFLRCRSDDWPFEFVAVHGHTPERRGLGELQGHRINLDAGCYRTGRMAALVIAGEKMRLIEAVGPNADELA